MNYYPSAILFDLDDTLISFDGVTQQAWDKCCGDFISGHSPPFTKEELLLMVRKTSRWYWSDPVRHKAGRADMMGARRKLVKVALAELGITDMDMSNELADHYTAYQSELVHLFPTTIPTLTALKERGVRMGLITNGTSEGQRAKLARFGLEGFFEVILIEQEVGYGKPDPRVFELALRLLELPARDVWMVGDNLIWDVQAPQTVGIYSIWNDYRRVGLPGDSGIVPDRIISNVSELLTEKQSSGMHTLESAITSAP